MFPSAGVSRVHGRELTAIESFPETLRQRRKKLDLTQEGLADLVGVSVSTVKKMESGLRRPSRQVAPAPG